MTLPSTSWIRRCRNHGGEQYCAMRRWHRELRTHDVLATPAAPAADQELKACAAKLKDYTTRVFQALNEG